MMPDKSLAAFDSARLIVLTVPEAREAFAPLEGGGCKCEGTTNFQIVSGDVGTIRAHADSLLAEWGALRMRLGIASRFNDPATFLRGVAGHHGMPCILFVRAGATRSIIVGAIEDKPLIHNVGYLRIKTPRLRTLRIVETGILCVPDAAAPESIARVLSGLLRFSAVDHLAIHNLPVDHPLTGYLNRFTEARTNPKFGLVRVPRVHWRTQLLDPATGEPLVHHSGKTRYNLRRISRKLNELLGGKVELVHIERADQVDAFVRDATSIIRQTYQAALGIGVKDTPAYRQLLIDTARDGCLCGYELRTSELAIAYLVGDIYEKTFRLWATSFLPQYRTLSPGIVLISRVLGELAAQGVAVVDFGVGEAEYKSMFGSELRHEVTWRIYSGDFRGRIAFHSDHVTEALNSIAHRVLGSRNLIRRVKKAWRARLTKKSPGKGSDAPGSDLRQDDS